MAFRETHVFDHQELLRIIQIFIYENIFLYFCNETHVKS